MSTLDRALKWIRENDGPIPNYVHGPLHRAGFLKFNSYQDWLELNEAGIAAQRERGWERAAGGWWKPREDGDT